MQRVLSILPPLEILTEKIQTPPSDKNIQLARLSDYNIMIIPEQAFDYAKKHPTKLLGNLNLGVQWQDQRFNLYMDPDENTALHRQYKPYISDTAYRKKELDKHGEQQIAAISPEIQSWFFTEAEYEIMRDYASKLRGYPMGVWG